MFTPELITFDDKWRIAVPTKQREFFPNDEVYAVLQNHGMVLVPK
jgi:DNA-binding transcriptional regulator/RsmH inhibitor MraZ